MPSDEEEENERKRKSPDVPGEKLWRGCARGKKQKFAFGNYDHYYGYRIGSALTEDPRLSHFKKEWFEGKSCLDIGCNEGFVTINIALRFCVNSMRGMDIDKLLISKANANLRRMVKTLKSFEANDAPIVELEVEEKESSEKFLGGFKVSDGGLTSEELRERVSFTQANVLDINLEKNRYDVILCLSVVKWIQLNWGDDGLKKLFGKVHRSLKKGGIFILEPQPWKSYKNNRSTSPAAKENFEKIKIKPEDFVEVLLDKVGFHSYEEITAGIPESTKGFDRPIFIFYKK